MKSVIRFHALLSAAAVCLGASSLALVPTEAAAQASENSIERVEATQTGNSTVLTVQMKSPVAGTPPSFSVANPARVAIDLPQTVNN
jgi:type IV pilus assembly protein PilQ